jgi:integrase/recombinase XerC
MLKEKFIDYIRFEKRFSPHTVLSYEHDLAQFEKYLLLQYQQTDLSAADHNMIRSWVVSLLEQEITARTVNRKLSTLKSFFHFCLRIGEVKINPMLKVTSPKSKNHLPVFIEKDKIEHLFNRIEFGDGFEALRDKLLITLLYATGMRRSELIGIKLGDIDIEKQTIKVLGKRSKERIIPLGSYLCRQIEIYYQCRENIEPSANVARMRRNIPVEETDTIPEIEKNQIKNNHDFLFVSSLGHSMDARSVYSIVHKYLSLISSQTKLSPHVLRHTFATHMLNDGAELNAIKEILGHTSLAATQVYTHNTIEKLKSIYKQAHPRA